MQETIREKLKRMCEHGTQLNSDAHRAYASEMGRTSCWCFETDNWEYHSQSTSCLVLSYLFAGKTDCFGEY